MTTGQGAANPPASAQSLFGTGKIDLSADLRSGIQPFLSLTGQFYVSNSTVPAQLPHRAKGEACRRLPSHKCHYTPLCHVESPAECALVDSLPSSVVPGRLRPGSGGPPLAGDRSLYTTVGPRNSTLGVTTVYILLNHARKEPGTLTRSTPHSVFACACARGTEEQQYVVCRVRWCLKVAWARIGKLRLAHVGGWMSMRDAGSGLSSSLPTQPSSSELALLAAMSVVAIL